MLKLKLYIADLIVDKLSVPELTREVLLGCFDTPPSADMGDIALACFQLSKVLRKSPIAIASELAVIFNEDSNKDIAKVENAGGYLNFFLSDAYRVSLLNQILANGEAYGSNELGKGKTMVIDYSSPNIAKRFHIGHLGTTIIGNSIKLIHRFCGYHTVGINYLGDWGTQYGKLVVAFKKWGNEEDIRRIGIEELNRLYVLYGTKSEEDPQLNDEARAEFAKLEAGDEENLRLWRLFKEISLKEYMKTYELLGISFDSFNGESFYSDKMPAVVEELKAKNLLKLDDGASLVDLEAFHMPPCQVGS